MVTNPDISNFGYQVVACTVILPMIVQIGIMAGIGVAALLAILVYYYW